MFIKYAFATQNTFFISFYSIPFHFISLCIYLLHHILFKNAISFKDVMHDIDYIQQHLYPIIFIVFTVIQFTLSCIYSVYVVPNPSICVTWFF